MTTNDYAAVQSRRHWALRPEEERRVPSGWVSLLGQEPPPKATLGELVRMWWQKEAGETTA